MADATALQAYTTIVAIETAEKAEDHGNGAAIGYNHSITLAAAKAKIIEDNAGVTTEAEALEGIELALGKDAGTTADQYTQGDFLQRKVYDSGGLIASPNIFLTCDGLYVTSLA